MKAMIDTPLIPPADKRCHSPWTHFVWKGHYAHGFSLDTCEQCGKQVEGANAVQIHEPRERLLKVLHLIEVAEELQTQGHCDALGGCACEDCYVDEPEEG